MDFDLESLRGRKAGLILQEHCRKAAVIIPLIKTENGPEVLFEVRSEKIGRQPGDVCFPGGALLEGEAPLDAAVRETCEELLISPDQLEIICACDMFHNASTLIYPFAAYLRGGVYGAAGILRKDRAHSLRRKDGKGPGRRFSVRAYKPRKGLQVASKDRQGALLVLRSSYGLGDKRKDHEGLYGRPAHQIECFGKCFNNIL